MRIQKFLLLPQSPLIFAARSYRDLSSWHWNPAWVGGPAVGLELLTPKIALPYFYPPYVGVEAAYSKSVPLQPVWIDVVALIP